MILLGLTLLPKLMLAVHCAMHLCNAVPGRCVVDAMEIIRVGATRVTAYTRITQDYVGLMLIIPHLTV